MSRSVKICYQGEIFVSHHALADYLNISTNTLYSRLKSKYYDNNNLLERKDPQQKLIGKKFNHLTVEKRITSGKNSTWLFKCDCGKEVVRRLYAVVHGKTISCGHVVNKKHHDYRIKVKEANEQEFNLQMKKLNELAQKVTHTKIGKRNRSGIIGVTKVCNYNQRGKKYVYWQASLNVNNQHFLRRFKDSERFKAMIQRGLWEKKYLGEIQPGIKTYLDNYLKLNNITSNDVVI
ncbi:hypothetical protein ACQW5G_00865 [Fructilactobacillus sp. Tb1]|uniref:hypothetical protein n=1 Tax=Fructilactobacillus sp. Tb1 TaxID=3422304 RepID=UPI003D2A9A77